MRILLALLVGSALAAFSDFQTCSKDKNCKGVTGTYGDYTSCGYYDVLINGYEDSNSICIPDSWCGTEVPGSYIGNYYGSVPFKCGFSRWWNNGGFWWLFGLACCCGIISGIMKEDEKSKARKP